ncbi:MAG: hypothetical protein RSG52_04955 [Terrisporobacter sp.]|uniref:hypothetical protein n=1 Tax=Terrisporobacter sp. TaxID=1965305 RepID=UPI002FCAAD97
MKYGIKKNFSEIRKLIGYKNEESIAEVLGLTRQTLSKFGACSDDAYEDNTNNTLLLSILAFIDHFIYEHRFDIENIDNYIDELDGYFFSEIMNDNELRNEIENAVPLYFYRDRFYTDGKIGNRYVKLWLGTFKYEDKDDENIGIDYTQPTILQIVSNYHIYILSDFLLEDNAAEFLANLSYILAKEEKQVKISNHTIDVIQDSRLSYEGNIYKNSIEALKNIKGLKDLEMLQIIESNPWSKNEIELVKSEICKLDKKNVIVFTQNTNEILKMNSYGVNSISNKLNLDFKILCLKLNENENINFDEKTGYEIYHSIEY